MQYVCMCPFYILKGINYWLNFLHTDVVPFLKKVSKGAKIRTRYNQVPHLTQDDNGKVTNSQLDTTNGSQEVSPFLANSADHNEMSAKHVIYLHPQ